MPTFYNYTEGGYVYSFDDVFVSADAFRGGNLWTWGSNGSGQLGVNDAGATLGRSTPVTTFAGGTNWKQVLNNSRAAIKTDGTLWTWGSNPFGGLGINNTTSPICTPVTTFAGGTNWKQVSGAGSHTAAIKTDGTLWTWGSNANAQLGDNTGTNRLTPVTTFAGGTNWKQVACGANNFVVAIKTNGTLWTWGVNVSGQLGTNDVNVRSTPVTTFAGGTNWKQVSCGSDHVAAIKTDGTLWTWGYNNDGALGGNTTTNISTPVTTFAGGTNWKQVACSGGTSTNTAAIKTDGTLWTWGRNTNGQLGDNTTSNRLIPVTTFAGGTNWKQIACGSSHTAAIKTDGTLWNWGINTSAQLGDNTTTQRLTPVTTFAGGTNWKEVGGGLATTYIDSYQ